VTRYASDFAIRFEAEDGTPFDPQNPPYQVGQTIDVPYRNEVVPATVLDVEVTDDRRYMFVSLRDQ